MLPGLHVATAFLVSVTFGLVLAHALEMPGKMRLNEETYLALQAIYYPGFTIGGASEPLAIVATLILLLITPVATPPFWLTLTAAVNLFLVQLVFWVITQPVNRYWLRSKQLNGLGAKFFSIDGKQQPTQVESVNKDWRAMRDRWEYSHLLRAIFSGIALIAILVSVTI